MITTDRPCSDPAYVTVDTLQDLSNLITAAKNPGSVRVRGAMHSVEESIVADGTTPTTLCLGKDFQTIGFDTSNYPLVQVGAGLRLGGDPDEGVPASVGVLNWLATRTQPFSVPDLGGITHQSVGGFLSTGSSGGSLNYSLDDAIVSITFMDGNGQQHTVTPSNGDFAAVGVSMGLFGVITEIEIKPVPRFAIFGTESTTDVDKAAFQPFAAGPTGLEAYLRSQDYCRIMWWPQEGVEKLVTWRASKGAIPVKFKPDPYQEIGDPDEDPVSYPPEIEKTLVPNLVTAVLDNIGTLIALFVAHRNELPDNLIEWLERTINTIITEKGEGLERILNQATSSEIQQFGVDLYFSLLGNRKTNALAKDIFTTLFGDETTFETYWSPIIMNGIFLVDDGNKIVPGPQSFQDYGDLGLPMDNQISDRLMPTEFTELWIPIDQTVPVMTAMRDHYAQGKYDATGTYACELYATKASEFWMSPAFNTDVIRVDVFWFARNGDQTAPQYYQQFWDLLKPYKFRPHWGKYLPPVSGYGPAYYQSVYPRLADFLNLRAQYDPKQIFVTDYWREQLGIAQP
jgi:FAD/FMN-containing dehydrogenase